MPAGILPRAADVGIVADATSGPAHLWARVVAWIERREWDEGAVLMALGALIGAAAGLGVVAFYHLIDLASFVFVTWPGARLGMQHDVVWRPFLTAAGLWAAWALVRRTRVPDGQTVPDVQLAIAKHGGRVPLGPVGVRTLASAITLGSGGSAGGEGPTAVLGAAVGSAVARFMRLAPRRAKILVGCGAAAGISAAFNAPFTGAFFALEEVLGSFSVGAFSPVVVASVIGALTVRPFLGSHPAFRVPVYGDLGSGNIVFLFPLLGVACGLGSALYTRMFFATADVGPRVPGPEWMRPVVGGFLVGAVVLASGGLLVGNGHLAIPTPIFGRIAWYTLLGIAFGKMLATALTLGTGGSGGVFTPTLFIGAAFGGGLGALAADLLPARHLHPEAWGLVGMAGLVAGATRAPLTAIFMVFDLTDDYTIILPLMIVAVISYTVAGRLAPYGLYDGWLARRGEHLAHGADRAIMDRLRVSDALDAAVQSVPSGATLAEVIAAAAQTRHTSIPVVEEDGALVGVISYDELRQALLDQSALATVVVAADLAELVETVSPDASLREALRVMNARAHDVVPVVENANGRPHLCGVLSRADLLAAYERELVHAV